MQQLVLMIRIDHFPEMRSMIGPERAGVIQRQVFNVVRAACRSSDKVSACHEDECGAIAWVSDPDNGSVLADRIQERVRKHVFKAGDGLEFGLTCSIGFSAHPSVENDPDRVIWKQTVSLARSAVDTASRWSDDAWFGYLGGDGPPPAVSDGELQARQLDKPSRKAITPPANNRFWKTRSPMGDRREEGEESRRKPAD